MNSETRFGYICLNNLEKVGETKKLSNCVNSCHLKEKKKKTKHKFSGSIEKKTELFWSRYSFGEEYRSFCVTFVLYSKLHQTKNPMAGKDLVIVYLFTSCAKTFKNQNSKPWEFAYCLKKILLHQEVKNLVFH